MKKKLLEEIKKFRDAGFEVIMDDFGSGNSSFKTLKNVNFDEIKIDMSLIESFDLKSTTIITSIIEMSKKLGIRTLAEGIESESQAEFLKNLGCEKIQGFFFDRPQPEKMFWQHIAEKNISVENRMNRYFYDEIGKVNFLTGESIALFEYNASGIREVFLNAQYKKSLALSGLKENKALEKIFSSSKYDLGKKLKKLANSALKKRKKVSADFILNNRLCSLTFESIAECPEYSMLLSTINSIPLAKEKNLKEEFDSILRNLVTAYETVFVCDAEKNTIRCIYTAESGFRGNNSLYLSEQLLSKIEGQIYRADIERFKKIMSRSYVESALEKSASGTLTEFFRVKNPDGTFHWKFFTIVPIAESLGTKYVVGVRPAELFGEKNNVLIEKLVLDQDFLSLDSTSIKNLYSNEYNLWNSMISDSQIKFFWKDTKRRFLGASQSFLDYYGFKSADEIIGKTDDDLHWHIEDESFRDDEYKVLHDGEIIINRHGQNIIKGILHNISATKFPLYKNGKICGLIGYFTDLDSILPEQLKIKNAAFTDSVTQFMTARGFLVALFGYEDNLYIHGEDYTIGLLEIPEYLFFYKTYGKETAESLAKMIADKIRLYFDESTILGRIQHGRFAVCTKKIKSLSEMREIIRECTESIMDIREVDGKRCGLHVRHGEVLGSEAHSSLQLLELLVNRMSDYQKKNWDFSVTELKIRLKDMGVFFDDISVVDIASNQVVGFYDDGSTFVISDNCCKILGNEKKCGTCIAAKALSKMGSASKFEIINDNIYFMIAHGITVENKSYVIEGIMKLDDLPFANENRKTNTFFDKLSKYSIEIYLDSLTKAHNRKYYDEQIAETNCQAIAFLDMNKFKFINDTYGHRLGDYVLQKTSEAIISSIRTKDTVSRYGGDEFIVCFEEISFEEFEKCLMQIHRNVAKICYGDENEFRASVSIGGCFGPGKACELVVKADDALYDAKKNHGIKIVRG
ncbi:GGDEF domain-containing protein [Treponema zioleckii]|uniref:GGDEF domain-containing protein n=1 Tax=Treponema zioleckii TaxID=331680 RepID=UPI00168AA7B7|nr:GGDEF domain-containing protein [Treponema zioleckii]